MTRFLDDIVRQPTSLATAIDFFCGAGERKLQSGASAIRAARHVYLSGIGSSYHAALGAASSFYLGSLPVYLQDAAELLHFSTFPAGSVIILISRSGQSVEIVNLLSKAEKSGAVVIGLTNSADGSLAQQAQVPVIVPVEFDHAISVNTYSTLAAAAAALACVTLGAFKGELKNSLLRAVNQTARELPRWQEQIANTPWLEPHASYCFLARGASLASCQEARLLWEEGVKLPATAMGTGSFRHGPQETVRNGSRFLLWIDGERMREQDLAVARDLEKLGALVALIGQDLGKKDHGLVFAVPQIPSAWQFLLDIIPAQLAAERLARLSGSDPDAFRICSYIVRGEYGLTTDELAARNHEH